MASPHVALPPELELPFRYQHVNGYLLRADADLRLRRSLEHKAYFVLERRCRRRPATNTGMRLRSDMHLQARDGYIHVSTVHPNFLNKPWNIIRVLKDEGEDLFAKGAEHVADEIEYEDKWNRETRRRRRRGLFRDMTRDFLATLARRQGSRVSNPGLSPARNTATRRAQRRNVKGDPSR